MAVLHGLAESTQRSNAGPLIVGHVLQSASAMQHGTTVKAFERLGHHQPSVMAAIQAETILAA